MKPTKTLTEAQYQNLVYSLMNAPSWGDYLNGCEAEFLEVNRDFYPLLLHAIQGAKMPFYRDLNALLLANPGMKKDDISFPDLEKLKAMEAFVRQRMEGKQTATKPQAQGTPAAPAEELTFEGLFNSPAVAPLVARAMQEAEAGPLLNEDGACILFGKATVAPLQALADVLFARNLVRKGITKKAAYLAICARFGFEASSRPDKARTEGEGVYRDYLEGFRAFFLNNRPE